MNEDEVKEMVLKTAVDHDDPPFDDVVEGLAPPMHMPSSLILSNINSTSLPRDASHDTLLLDSDPTTPHEPVDALEDSDGLADVDFDPETDAFETDAEPDPTKHEIARTPSVRLVITNSVDTADIVVEDA